MRRVSEADKARMKKMFESGATLQEVADEIGISISGVSKWRIKMNLVPTGHVSSKKRDLMKRARHLFVDLGWSRNRIARELGLDQTTVGAWARQEGWEQTFQEESPNPWAHDKPSVEELLLVWNETMEMSSNFTTKRGSSVRVAERLGVSSSTAQRWLAEAGISNDTHSEVVKIREEVIEMFGSGKLTQDIIETTGTTKEFVSKTLREAGHDIPTLMEERYEQIKDQLPAAWERSKRWNKREKRFTGSALRVGREFGVSQSTAQRWLVLAGLAEQRGATFDTDHAVQLFMWGWSIPRIAAEMEINEATLRKWLSSAGYDLRNPHQRRSHEEKLAFRRSVSRGKTASVAGSGRFDYNGVRLDSTYEVRFATELDRLGMKWRAWDRVNDGVIEVDVDGDVVRYAPDFVVGDDMSIEVKGIFDRLAKTKVRAFRDQRGQLAMVMKDELLEFEGARDAADAIAVLRAACYLTPPTDPAYWD